MINDAASKYVAVQTRKVLVTHNVFYSEKQKNAYPLYMKTDENSSSKKLRFDY